MIKIKQGLDLPIAGSPGGKLSDPKKVRSVALLGNDYNGLKASVLVEPGQKVKLGQTLFLDKKNPGVKFTSPGGGTIQAVNRGLRRSLQSIVIDLDNDEEEVSFNLEDLQSVDPYKIRDNLIDSGLWTSLRKRPFSKIPSIEEVPSSIFINAMDTNPLSLDPELVISLNKEHFYRGIEILKRLTEGKVYICASTNSSIEIEGSSQLEKHIFSGPHPAGLSGTHMHFISPPTLTNINWHISYADVISFGEFFSSGKLPTKKYISLAGPQVEDPKIFLTRIGASTDEICNGELKPADNRVISGSVIGGKEAIGAFAYLGKYHNQISVIEEASPEDRELFDWGRLGFNRYSFIPLFISNFLKSKKYNLKTLMYGPDRAILPIGTYEKVFPLEMLITVLLRYIVVGDTEKIQSLGGLELDEEDLALCSFVCPSKYDFGSLLKENLARIEVEG